MRDILFISAIALSLIMPGCGGGGPTDPGNGNGNGDGNLVVGQIQGPETVAENTSAQYSVSASGDTGITYQWSVDPTSAGNFTIPTSAATTFNAAEVSSDTNATIQVVVNSDHGGPLTRTKRITITDVPRNDLELGEIRGPTVIQELVPETYSIDASGGEWYSYQWSVVPPDEGLFDSPEESSTEFTALECGTEVEREMEITVDVKSDAGSGSKSLVVTVLKWTDANAYLDDGHPMWGINYQRNNRSKHLLPESLDAAEVMEPACPVGSPSGLFIAGDERLYYSTYFHRSWVDGPSQGPNAWEDYYRLWSFYFGEECGEGECVGWDTVISTIGAFSSGVDRYHRLPAGHGDYWYTVTEDYRLYRFGGWPQVVAQSRVGFGASVIPAYPALGSKFACFLPLPDGHTIASFEEEHYSGPTTYAVQLLDENLGLVQEYGLPSAVLGLAFDGTDGTIYVNTDAGLYAFGLDLTEKWNTGATLPGFTGGYPIIADDRGIIGIRDGVLRRVETDGTIGPEQDCGGLCNPVSFNDGSIAVITASYVSVFDPLLDLIDEIPLPTGPETGSTYSTEPIVDADDNMALVAGADLYIIDRDGNALDHRLFETDIKAIRLGPEHLFVLVGEEIYSFAR